MRACRVLPEAATLRCRRVSRIVSCPPAAVVIQGLVASIVASVLFGAMYYLAPALAPLDGEQIFGWRVLCTLPFTTALLLARGQWPRVRLLAARAWRQPLLALGLLASAAMLGVQLWLFLWAPLHGRALPVSLGYFLLPLVMVLAGRLVFNERLSRLQQVATALASAGVAWELLRGAGLDWPTWLVAIGYTAYFVLRRLMRTDSLAGHWLDVLILLPVCLWFVVVTPVEPVNALSGWLAVVQTPKLHIFIPLLGVVSGIALALYMTAHRLLPLGLFGLLSYVEPILLLLAAMLLGERIQPGQEVMYFLIAAAVVVMAFEGLMQLRNKPGAS